MKHSSAIFFISYELKLCSASAWSIDVKSGKRKEPSLVSRLSRCVATFDILAFFLEANDSNWFIVVLSIVSPSFNSSFNYEMGISDNIWSFFFMKMHHHILQNLCVARWQHSAGKFYTLRLVPSDNQLFVSMVTHLLSSALIPTKIYKKMVR